MEPLVCDNKGVLIAEIKSCFALRQISKRGFLELLNISARDNPDLANYSTEHLDDFISLVLEKYISMTTVPPTVLQLAKLLDDKDFKQCAEYIRLRAIEVPQSLKEDESTPLTDPNREELLITKGFNWNRVLKMVIITVIIAIVLTVAGGITYSKSGNGSASKGTKRTISTVPDDLFDIPKAVTQVNLHLTDVSNGISEEACNILQSRDSKFALHITSIANLGSLGLSRILQCMGRSVTKLTFDCTIFGEDPNCTDISQLKTDRVDMPVVKDLYIMKPSVCFIKTFMLLLKFPALQSAKIDPAPGRVGHRIVYWLNSTNPNVKINLE